MAVALDLDALIDVAGDDADPDDVELDQELVAKGGFAEFIRLAWPHVDTSPLQWNWHHDAVAEHLEALHKRQIKDLVINIPPGCSKSLVVGVLFPAWVWTHDPEHRFITASYDGELALRDSRKHRTLVASEWYRARWDVQIPSDRTASVSAALWANTAGGLRNAVTVRGAVTGKHADTSLVDDPVDTTGAAQASGKELDEVIEWHNKTMPMRFRDPPRRARALVMQRLHMKDLAAEMKRQGAVVLCLPMRFEAQHPDRLLPRRDEAKGLDLRGDPRTENGELLHPERYPEDVVQALETALGTQGTAAQLQQRPAPPGGGIFKAACFRYWVELPLGGTFAISVDCTFKKTTDGSFVVIQVWYTLGPNFYLVTQRRERMSFGETIAAILALSLQWPKAYKKLVEDKANGEAVVDTLKRDVPGLHLVTPEGGKEARANAVEPLVTAGNVFLPHPEKARYPDGSVGAPWVDKDPPGEPGGSFLGEVTTFPNAAHDDQTDTMTQFLNHAAPRLGERLRRAVEGATGAR